MDSQDIYRTLSKESEGLFKEKGSKFLAFAYCVEDEEVVKEKVAALKKNTTMPGTIAMGIYLGITLMFSGQMMTVNRATRPVIPYSVRFVRIISPIHSLWSCAILAAQSSASAA